MNTQNFVGIDVSKSALDVAVVGSDQTIATVSNDARGHEKLVSQLTRLSPELIVLEATGGYQHDVTLALAAVGLPVVVVNPRPARDPPYFGSRNHPTARLCRPSTANRADDRRREKPSGDGSEADSYSNR